MQPAKKEKDPNAPKRGLSSYMFFANERRPGLKVLFTTGFTRNAIVHNGVLDPGTHLIQKPFSIEQLAMKVRDVLDPIEAAAG